MVHYIITPWRHRQELLNVRQALYGSAAPSSEEKQRKAVALVSIWVQRGNCPHLVESTALIIAAILNENSGASAYAMRAAYSTAICRYVYNVS
jgi:ribosomal biogenesis protein LAS1